MMKTIAFLVVAAALAGCASPPDYGLFVVARDSKGYPTAWVMGVSQAEADKRYLDSQMRAQKEAWAPGKATATK